MIHRICTAVAALAFIGGTLSGCTMPPRETRFEVINHTTAGDVERLHDIFDECYYAVSPSGNVDIVARRFVRADAAPGGDAAAGEKASVLQIVHLKTMYLAKPGTTFADSTMINGTVAYAIVVGQDGTSFEGGCFLSCSEDRRHTTLTGRLEHSHLLPTRRAGGEAHVFDKAEVTGTFKAVNNPQKTIGLLNELNRFFGPQPDYQKPSEKPSPI